jgi:hypothetical protein
MSNIEEEISNDEVKAFLVIPSARLGGLFVIRPARYARKATRDRFTPPPTSTLSVDREASGRAGGYPAVRS